MELKLYDWALSQSFHSYIETRLVEDGRYSATLVVYRRSEDGGCFKKLVCYDVTVRLAASKARKMLQQMPELSRYTYGAEVLAR